METEMKRKTTKGLLSRIIKEEVRRQLNEVSAKKGLEQVIKGDTTDVEGIKVSKEMAQAMLDWFKSSPYGKQYPKALDSGLFVSLPTMMVFGLDKYAKHEGADEELKYLLKYVNQKL